MSGLIRHLSILQSHVFLVNSRLGHSLAASLTGRPPFSRSYRVILPSSLAVNHSSTLVYSTRPPVSVYGTGRAATLASLFLEACPIHILGPEGPPVLSRPLQTLQRAIPSARRIFSTPSAGANAARVREYSPVCHRSFALACPLGPD